ncbi:MAG: hypothetical protein ACOX1T_04160 [Saccharofermentanales bacterium]|jgi:hypothetical protein
MLHLIIDEDYPDERCIVAMPEGILIVDDEHEIADLIVLYLTNEGPGFNTY